ncbi:MAG: PHP domain-containing protein [Candidatus Lokiarchaeota archaeon]|nr:PHP domain-containing protein [Candidatus Lokiarchaeota archaeon]
MKDSDFHMHSNYSDGFNLIREMVEAAIDRDLKNIAITDHISASGHFLYTFSKSRLSLENYLDEITRLRRKYEKKIHIYAGVEITDDFVHTPKSHLLENKLYEYIDFISLILIETILIAEPVRTALNVREYLNQIGDEQILVVFAHPDYSAMNFSTFQLLLKNRIGFELNESKLSERDAAFFLEFVNQLSQKEKKDLLITVGSDAHRVKDVGRLNFVFSIVEDNNLWKYVITPPKVQDFIL